MGGSQSREQLEQVQVQLKSTQDREKVLKAERDALKTQLDAQAAELQTVRSSLASATSETAALLDAKEEALNKAVKQKQLAEELRRSDALLAKRLMHSQLRHLGGQQLPTLGSSGADNPEGTMAASLALAAQDEMQLRQMLMHTANELEASQKTCAAQERSTLADKRSELARELWLPGLCDVSATVRSPSFLALGGLRLPRAPPRPGVQASGVSPAVAVMRFFGAPAMDGQWAAVGGSLLYDASRSELSAMRLALAAQPAPNQQISLSFDHTGGLTGSVKAAVNDGLSARIFGTIDLNRQGGGRAGLDVTYDLPQ